LIGATAALTQFDIARAGNKVVQNDRVLRRHISQWRLSVPSTNGSWDSASDRHSLLSYRP
jgi:hypothetical protein